MALILVVDDEVGIARLLEEVFSDEGHEVISASNGKQALERVSDRIPAFILTDYMMPVMDGIEMIEILASNPATSAVPIVLMSSMPENVIDCKAITYAAFVRKPFKIYDVIDLTTRLLSDRSE